MTGIENKRGNQFVDDNPKLDPNTRRIIENSKLLSPISQEPKEKGVSLESNIESFQVDFSKEVLEVINQLKQTLSLIADKTPENIRAIRNSAHDLHQLYLNLLPEDRQKGLWELSQEIINLTESEQSWSKLKDAVFVDNLVCRCLLTETEVFVTQLSNLSQETDYFDSVDTKALFLDLSKNNLFSTHAAYDLLNYLVDALLTDEKKTINPEDLDILSSFSQKLYPQSSSLERKNLQLMMFDLAYKSQLNLSDRAVFLIDWYWATQKLDRFGEIQANEESSWQMMPNSEFYLVILPDLLGQSYYNLFSQKLMTAILENQNQAEHVKNLIDLDSLFDDLSFTQPAIIAEAMAESFVQAGLLRRTSTGKIKLNARADRSNFNFEHISNVAIAQRVSENLIKTRESNIREVTNLGDIEHLYKQSHQDGQLTELEIQVSGNSARIMFLAGLGLGNQDFDIRFFCRTLEAIKNLPENTKPQVIVVNGLLQGAFENRNKALKTANIDGLQTLEDQVKGGKIMIDELRALGIPVILNVGQKDWEIARDIVLRIFRHLFDLMGHITYYDQDKLQRTDEWGIYDRFVVTMVLPYCLKTGQMLSNQELIDMLALYDELESAKSEHRSPRLDVYAEKFDLDLLLKNQDITDGLVVVDDACLKIKTDDETIESKFFDSFSFSNSANPPLYQAPAKSLVTWISQLKAAGIDVSGYTTMMNQYHTLIGAINNGDNWIESVPGMQNDHDFTNKKGANRRDLGANRRAVTTRRELTFPTTIMREVRDGSRIYHLFNDRILDKMNSISRTLLLLSGDVQTGSLTAFPHLLIKSLHRFLDEAAQVDQAYIIDGGDDYQGDNYFGKKHEEQGMPLTNIEHQESFYLMLLNAIFSEQMNQEQARKTQVRLINGNHELNSGFAMTGYGYKNGLHLLWEEIFKNHGLSDREIAGRVKNMENVVTQDGDFIRSHTGFEKIGPEIEWMFQHIITKMMGKGGKGNPPIYLAKDLLMGAESLVENVDGASFFHFHTPWIYTAMGKVMTIAPSLAGLSGYEWYLGLRPVTGMQMIRLGGGLPIEVEFIPGPVLNNYQIKDGLFCEESLNDLGYKTDPAFIAQQAGFLPRVDAFSKDDIASGRIPQWEPQSALNKFLWDLILKIPRQVGSRI